jgi:hypothetical protein
VWEWRDLTWVDWVHWHVLSLSIIYYVYDVSVFHSFTHVSHIQHASHVSHSSLPSFIRRFAAAAPEMWQRATAGSSGTLRTSLWLVILIFFSNAPVNCLRNSRRQGSTSGKVAASYPPSILLGLLMFAWYITWNWMELYSMTSVFLIRSISRFWPGRYSPSPDLRERLLPPRPRQVMRKHENHEKAPKQDKALRYWHYSEFAQCYENLGSAGGGASE